MCLLPSNRMCRSDVTQNGQCLHTLFGLGRCLSENRGQGLKNDPSGDDIDLLIFFYPVPADASTLLGTNRKPGADDGKPAKTPTKLTQDDFKTTYMGKSEQDKDRNSAGSGNDQYEVVDTSYVCIRLKQKWLVFFTVPAPMEGCVDNLEFWGKASKKFPFV